MEMPQNSSKMANNSQNALPPIFMSPARKGQQKKSPGVLTGANVTTFNQTKKTFPMVSKVNAQKRTYVSPYSIKAI